jgi:hypothetical protein
MVVVKGQHFEIIQTSLSIKQEAKRGSNVGE